MCNEEGLTLIFYDDTERYYIVFDACKFDLLVAFVHLVFLADFEGKFPYFSSFSKELKNWMYYSIIFCGFEIFVKIRESDFTHNCSYVEIEERKQRNDRCQNRITSQTINLVIDRVHS